MELNMNEEKRYKIEKIENDLKNEESNRAFAINMVALASVLLLFDIGSIYMTGRLKMFYYPSLFLTVLFSTLSIYNVIAASINKAELERQLKKEMEEELEESDDKIYEYTRSNHIKRY